MTQFLIILVILSSLIGLLSVWRRDRKLLSEARGRLQDRDAERTTARERAIEDLKTAQAELQRRWQYLAEAQRLSHSGTFGWKVRSGELVWSDETYRILGFTREINPTFDRVFDRVHPEDLDRVRQLSDRSAQTGMDFDVEHRILLPDGDIKYVHAVAHAGRDSAGNLEYMGVVTDITERKRAEEERQGLSRNLQETKARLEEAQRIAHMGSWAFNAAGHYWSDELYKIYGLDPQHGAPSPEQYLALVHPQDRASMADTIKRMQEEHRGFDQIERIVRPDGQLRYIRAVAVPVMEQGVCKGFVGTTMDVTEQELLTQELRREKAYLAEAQSLTHVGSWACNFVTGQIFHLSDETFRMYGFDPSSREIPFERFYSATCPEDEPALREKFNGAIQARQDYDLEYRICRTDGAIRCLRSIGHHNPSGEMGDYVGITMDITERKRAEEEREKLRQLEADLALINRVNMMGELAAALAHEIKQPIAASVTSAGACLRWLAHDPPDLGKARAAANRMKEDGHRAADVINRLRSFYKKGAPPQREMIDVKHTVLEMTKLLTNEATTYSVKINSQLDCNVPHVLADRVQLQQVFMNLMLNAIEAMKDTGGELSVKPQLNPEGQLMISISDTGVGLPPENAESIFDAFHTTKPQGTGLGLTITRSIVESHGGRIWASCNQGPGATFHFTIPVEAEGHA